MTSTAAVAVSANECATYDNFRFEAARLNSYVGWTCEHVEPRALVAADLYFTGHEDAVKCFDCRAGLFRWLKGDDPLIDHRRYSEHCRFVRGEPCGNVPLGTESDVVSPPKPRAIDVAGVFNSERRLLSDAVANTPVTVQRDDEGPPITITFEELCSKYSAYSSTETRIATFDAWPLARTQTKKQLADAGFWYDEKADRTLCYCCGLGLEGWEPTDVPLLEHLKWASACAFVQRQHAAAAAVNTTSFA